MMGVKTLKVIDNDFVYTDGRLDVLTGVTALSQLTQNRLKLWLGEWFLAQNEGIDYLGLFNQRQFLEKRFSLAIRNQILADTRIIKILSLSITLNRSTRTVTITLNLQADEAVIDESDRSIFGFDLEVAA